MSIEKADEAFKTAFAEHMQPGRPHLQSDRILFDAGVAFARQQTPKVGWVDSYDGRWSDGYINGVVVAHLDKDGDRWGISPYDLLVNSIIGEWLEDVFPFDEGTLDEAKSAAEAAIAKWWKEAQGEVK